MDPACPDFCNDFCDVQLVCVDTRFRNNYYGSRSTDCHITLPLTISRVKSMMLTSAEIPFCMNTFSRFYKNNYFHITRGGTTHQVIIQDGLYSPAEIAAYLTDTLATIPALTDISVQVAEPSHRLVFTSATTTEFILDFGLRRDATTSLSVNTTDVDERPLQVKAGWILGFRLAMYEGGHTYVPEGWFEPQSPRYMYLAVDDFNQGGSDFILVALNDSILRENILAKINIDNSAQGGMLIVTDRYKLRPFHRRTYTAGGVNIQKLRIRLLDEYGRVIDLCNMDYSFTLQFEVLP